MLRQAAEALNNASQRLMHTIYDVWLSSYEIALQNLLGRISIMTNEKIFSIENI